MGLFKKKKKKSSEEYDGYSYQDEGTADESYDSYDEPSEYSKDDYAYSEEDVYGEYGETMSRRKKKKSGLGGLIAVVAVILVLALLFVGVTSVIGPGKGACEEVIAEFQSSVNTLEDKRFLAVLEPETRRSIQVLFVTSTGSADTDLSNAFSRALDAICPGFLAADPNGDPKDVLEKIVIEPVKFGLPGKTRKVKCEVRYGNGMDQLVRITLQKYEGQCLIKSIVLVDQ